MEEEKEDRISQLPDEILQHIISLIDIQQAVQTSILSRRWKKVWLSLSDLNFIFYFNIYSKFPADWEVAKNFVDQFLSRRDHTSTTRKFHLTFEGLNLYEKEIATSHPSFVEKCTFYAINHDVTDLSLDPSFVPAFRVPGEFFACKTLRELTLRGFYNCIDLSKYSLPHLKILHIEYTNNFLKEPFSGFPELEELTLKLCRISGIAIFCPKLRNLELIRCLNYSDGAIVETEISTPELTSFRYESYFPLLCSKANSFPMLEEAYFDFKLLRKENTLICTRVLHQFGNAKIVTLSMDIIQALQTNGGDYIKQNPSPIFPNLKCLKLIQGYLKIPMTVRRRVMNYLTNTKCLHGDSVKVELPEGVSVVDSNLQDLFDEESEEILFQLED